MNCVRCFFFSSGIHCYIQNDSYESLEAVVPGPKETPYEEIQFKIGMEFDSHYPFRPPSAKFITPVYHPNIDTGNLNINFDFVCVCVFDENDAYCSFSFTAI